MECVSCKNKIPLGPLLLLRYSKNFNHFLYDWRPLTLLKIKLNLIEIINFGTAIIINNQTCQHKIYAKAFMRENYVLEEIKL